MTTERKRTHLTAFYHKHTLHLKNGWGTVSIIASCLQVSSLFNSFQGFIKKNNNNIILLYRLLHSGLSIISHCCIFWNFFLMAEQFWLLVQDKWECGMTLYSEREKARERKNMVLQLTLVCCLGGLSDNMHTTKLTTRPLDGNRDVLRLFSRDSIADRLHKRVRSLRRIPTCL